MTSENIPDRAAEIGLLAHNAHKRAPMLSWMKAIYYGTFAFFLDYAAFNLFWSIAKKS